MSPSPPNVTRYPVYVPSAGRYENCMTAKFLEADGVPFRLVVQPREYDLYRARHPEAEILTLPWDNDPTKKNGLLLARCWIRDHSIAEGHARHWQLDDNIQGIWRRWKARKIRCNAALGLRACEVFTDRYDNVGVSGLNYYMFAPNRREVPPYFRNVHVYSCTLIWNEMPYRWRLNYNDDTDLCLQVLSGGLCTILLNAFLAWKMTTMTCKGGNTDELYKINDGRLTMSRTLERRWPGIVETRRRFQRPQHVVRDSWKAFDTPLRLREGVDLSALPLVDEMGMELTQTREVKSPTLRSVLGQVREDGVNGTSHEHREQDPARGVEGEAGQLGP